MASKKDVNKSSISKFSQPLNHLIDSQLNFNYFLNNLLLENSDNLYPNEYLPCY